MFFSSKYETSEVLCNNIKVRYFKDSIMFIFISELNQELIKVTFIIKKYF